MSAPTKKQLKQACEDLSTKDTHLKHAYEAYGLPEWRTREPGFAPLARTIAYQQISTKAASTIWGRVEVLVGDITPENFIKASEEDLRAQGLSRPKIGHLKSISEAVVTGSLNFDRIAKASHEEAVKEMVTVKGIGPWTAEIYMMSALGRLDAFPASDIGLSEGYRMLQMQLNPEKDFKRLTPKAFEKQGEQWRPFRAVASILLWGYINGEREKAHSA